MDQNSLIIVGFAALLVGLSIACVAYFFLKKSDDKVALSKRIAGGSSVTMAPPGQAKKSDLAIKKLEKNKGVQKLKDAGLKNTRMIYYFYAVRGLSIIVPLLIIGYSLTQRTLTKDVAIKAFMVGGIIYAGLNFYIKSLQTKRQKAILRELPQFLDLMIVCIEAGLAFTNAMERVLKELDPKSPLTQEFVHMYNEFMRGLTLSEACARLDKRVNVPDLTILLSSIVQSDQMGSSLGKSLRIQAEDLRDKYRQRLRAKAMKIPVKILGPVVLIFLNLFIITLGPAIYQMKNTMGSM